MKKTIVIAISFAMAMSSCGASEEEASTKKEEINKEEVVAEMCDCFAKAKEEGDVLAKGCWSIVEKYEDLSKENGAYINFVSATKECRKK